MTERSAKARRGRLELRSLVKTYDTQRVVDGIDITVEAGEFFTILGPSGCGKTTTLMMLAGFATPTAGDVIIDGKRINEVAPQDRNIGVVFQNYALFPHMSVAENLAFPLEMRKIPANEIAGKVRAALDLVQLTAANRLPTQLSGGQQQRVAVARALIFDPPILLMDEPLGALDRKLRSHLQIELRRLQQRLGITVIYVTHDQDEAMSMSDRVAILNHGRVEQIGRPEELYENPTSLFVAQFLGENNVFQGKVDTRGRSFEGVEGGPIALALAQRFPAGTALSVSVRPERVVVTATDSSATAEGYDGEVRDAVFMGTHTDYYIEVQHLGVVHAKIANIHSAQAFTRGQAVRVHWRAEDMHIFPTPN